MIISGCKYYQKKDDEYFENNKKAGKGIYYCNEGDLKYDKFDGKGICYFNNGFIRIGF